MNPDPPIQTNVLFRKALMHGVDRQAMVDTFMHGYGGVAHSYLMPGDLDYPAVDSSIVKYDYDPRRATQMIEGLGFARGADGGFRDAAGERLAMEVRANVGTNADGAALAASDNWKQLGLDITTTLIPPERRRDLVYTQNPPAFHFRIQSRMLSSLSHRASTQNPLASNGWSGTNYSRYTNPDFDSLIERYYSTIPPNERREVVRQVLHLVSDQIPYAGLYYWAHAQFTRNSVLNVGMNDAEFGTNAWNSHEWDVRQA
jgi:peptide/nickel transport system substrate-binding protein